MRKTAILQFLKSLGGSAARQENPSTDRALLDRFATDKSESAFADLLKRHGPMVLGITRRITGTEHDAEDAFQATFLVLVQKAASLRSPELLANWLYGVATRSAMKVKAASLRRGRGHEQLDSLSDLPCSNEDDVAELLPYLDQAIRRLPRKYRVPVILCELQGRSRKEVALELGLPEGTLSSRLAKARKLLQHRLGRHVVSATSATLAIVFCPKRAAAAFRLDLIETTLRAAMQVAAGGDVSKIVTSRVLSLRNDTLRGAHVHKLKIATAAALLGGLLLVAVQPLLNRINRNEEQPPPAQTSDPKPVAWSLVPRHVLRNEPNCNTLQFSSGGKTLTYNSWYVIKRLDLRTGKTHNLVEDGILVVQRETESIMAQVSFTLSPDERMLVWTSFIAIDFDAQRIKGFDLSKNKELHFFLDRGDRRLPYLFNGNSVFTKALAFSPDGRTVFSVGGNDSDHRLFAGSPIRGTVMQWDLKTGKNAATMLGHDRIAWCVACSPDGKTLASGSFDKTVRLWDVKTRKTTRILRHPDKVYCVNYSPDGKSLVSVSKDGTMIVWDVSAGAKKATIQTDVSFAVFSQHGNLLATAHKNGAIRLWDAATVKELTKIDAHKCTAHQLAFSPDGRTLASYGGPEPNYNVRVWEVSALPVSANQPHDLRGPLRKVGQVYVDERRATITDAKRTITSGQTLHNGSLKVAARAVHRRKILAITDNRVTQCRTRVVTDASKETAWHQGGTETHTERSALEGETVLCAKSGKEWKITLAGKTPNAKQKLELRTFRPPRPERDYLPAKSVRPGHRWTVEVDKLRHLLGPIAEVRSGEWKRTFAKAHVVNGERRAEIVEEIHFDGKIHDTGGKLATVTFYLFGETQRSLDRGFRLSTKLTGTMTASSELMVDGKHVQERISGPVELEITTARE